MVSITVRDVPEATRNELAGRAAAAGQSLQEYLRHELVEMARRPTPATVMERVRERKRRASTPVTSAQILAHRDDDRR